MAVEYTKEQLQVIESRNENLLVSAAAGSGKTAVLVERIIGRVLDKSDPVDIDRILVVTFTNAAAMEMKNRVSQAIEKKLEEQPDNEFLQKQAAIVHNAQITTIDSFCTFLLKNHFQSIDLDPGYRVMDENERKLLEEDALKEILEEKFAEGNERFYRCVECFNTKKRDNSLELLILNLFSRADSHPFPLEWINERKNDYNLEDSILDFAFLDAKQTLEGAKELLQEALEVCNETCGPDLYAPMMEACIGLIDTAICEFQSFKDGNKVFSKLLDSWKSVRLATIKKDSGVLPELQDKVKKLKDEARNKIILPVFEEYFQSELDAEASVLEEFKDVLEELMELTGSFYERFLEKKREQKLIDFGDMEHLSLQILLTKDAEGNYIPSDIAKSYRSYFKEIMIDEYQDSNLVQELILSTVSGEAEGIYNRFMVGDVKQSIHRFRNARPELFIEKLDAYKTYDEISNETDTKTSEKADKNKDNAEINPADRNIRIDLHNNFRSRENVLDTVNLTFERLMHKNIGSIEYDKDAALYPGNIEFNVPESADDSYYDTELFVVPTASSEEGREMEAYVLAKRIKELVGTFMITDKKTRMLRPCRYGDIVILLRSLEGYDETIPPVFDSLGIPLYFSLKKGYFMATEVRSILQYLKILDNPLQDIAFYGALHSKLFDFSDEELVLLRTISGKGEKLYYGITKCLEKDVEIPKDVEEVYFERLRAKCEYFEQLYTAHRQLSRTLPVNELISNIFLDTDFDLYMRAMPDGERRGANLELLLERAKLYEQTSFHGLFHFVRYMDQLKKSEVDFGEANLLDENADVVRIMTIHSSKGLEFPVCFLAGTGKKMNRMDEKKSVLVDTDLGLGLEFVDPERRIHFPTLRKRIIKNKIRLESVGEELRVLYVAMTRPQDKLIITGYNTKMDYNQLNELKNRDLKEYKALNYVTKKRAESYLDWIMAVLLGETDVVSNIVNPEELSKEVLEDTKQLDDALKIERLHQLSLTNEVNVVMTDINQRLQKPYNHADLEGLFTKTSVSEIKMSHIHQSVDIDENNDGNENKGEQRVVFETELKESYVPTFMREDKDKEKITGTVRGSAFHRIMELLPFEELINNPEINIIEWLEKNIGDNVLAGRLSSLFSRALNRTQIMAFLQSDTCKRMGEAACKDNLYKEQPFVLGLPASLLNNEGTGKNFPDDETVLIQGIIDVFWEEEDGIVLLDYKTDRVNSEVELIERYKIQLEYYKKAISQILQKNVKEILIYSTCFDKTLSIDL